MKKEYHQFKKEVLTRDNYTCKFCGSKAIHTIYLDSKNEYNCARYYLILDKTESTCLRCYYHKLNSTTKKVNFQKQKWINKK